MNIILSRSKVWWLCTWLFAILWVPAQAQPASIPYQNLLLLVAGPSGDRIDPREKAVVDHLNGIRSTYNFSQLQMGTMHYDRPQEAMLLKKTLGFSPQKGITVGLVQLSDQGLPVRTLYKLEQVTQSSLLAAQNELLSRWSQTTGLPLPHDLRPAGTVGGPTSSNPPATTSSPPWMAPTAANPPYSPGTPSQVYTFEGIQVVINAIDDQIGRMWNILQNAPLRSDGNDLHLREQTKALAGATHALATASQNGVIFPLEQLATVSRVGRAWQATEPQYYLPVALRGEVEPLRGLLRMVEEIYTQGSKAGTSP